VGEDVGGLGHKVDAAEDHVLRVALGGGLGELVAVAGEVGEADDLVALVVMAEDEGIRAELLTCGCDARVHGVVGLGEVVVERAYFALDEGWGFFQQ
jgi:hypothetical protein